MNTPCVMIVDDDPQICRIIGMMLADEGAQIIIEQSVTAALARLKRQSVDVLFTDLKMPDGDGLTLIKEARKLHPDLPAVIITGYGSVDSSVGALQIGAVDYVMKPFRAEQLAQALSRALTKRRANSKAPAPAPVSSAPIPQDPLIAKSSTMIETISLAKRVVQSGQPILLSGEQGSGKETLLRAIMAQHGDTSRSFVKIACGSLSLNQASAILFGREHSGNGQSAPEAGAFERMAGGWLYLEDFGQLAPALQERIAQVVRSGVFVREGGIQSLPFRVRLAISWIDVTTSEESPDLTETLAERFRAVPIHVPALRQRREDILPLAEHLLRHDPATAALGQEFRLSSEARQILSSHDWPKNGDELVLLLRKAAVLTGSGEISAETVREILQRHNPSESVETISIPLTGDLRTMERAIVEELIQRNRGNKSAAARALGLHRKTLYRILEGRFDEPAAGTDTPTPV